MWKMKKIYWSILTIPLIYRVSLYITCLLGLTDQIFGNDAGLQRFSNLLKPTGHVMHHQVNIQQLYALPTLYLCVLYLSENKQRLVPLTA